jgi:DNA-directed RNA polymerase II subunit RPB1
MYSTEEKAEQSGATAEEEIRFIRPLTKDEIDDIIKDIPMNKNIPKDVAKSVWNNIVDSLRKQLESGVLINNAKVGQLKSEIIRYYYDSLISPGEMVGTIAATSAAAPVTQLTLNTFHFAGFSAFRETTMGLPRFQQLLNVTHESSSNMKIYLHNEYNQSLEKVRHIIDTKLTRTSFEDILAVTCINYDAPLTESDMKWFEFYRTTYSADVDPEMYPWSVRMYFDKEKIHRHKLTLSMLVKKIEDIHRDSYAIFYPDLRERRDGENPGKDNKKYFVIDIFFDMDNLSKGKKDLKDFSPDHDEDFAEFDFLKNVYIPYIKTVTIIPCDIIRCYTSYDIKDKQWIINTKGSDMKYLMGIEEVNFRKIETTNLWEVFETFGIEAFVEFLRKSLIGVITGGGAFVSERYIQLLIKIMTHLGAPRSASRYGINVKEVGTLAKVSFEEPFDNFIKAGLTRETEWLRGVSGRIITGLPFRGGTYYFDVLHDWKKEEQYRRESREIMNQVNDEMSSDQSYGLVLNQMESKVDRAEGIMSKYVVENRNQVEEKQEYVHEEYLTL